MQLLKCGNCGILNVISICKECNRHFVITKKRATEGMRQFDDEPLSEYPKENIDFCDLCQSTKAGSKPLEIVNAGLRQRTCPACHTEFLSAHGLEQEVFEKKQNDGSYRGTFGGCCDALKSCLEQPNPMFFVEENGTFFMSIGYAKTDNGVVWFDHAVFFCPFCGKQLQDKEGVAKRAKFNS
jgi:hypothetical protein